MIIKTKLAIAISLALLSWQPIFAKELVDNKLYSLCNLNHRNTVSLYKAFFEKGKTRNDILSLEKRIISQEWCEDESPHEIFHSFADGMYKREMHIKAGHIIVGAIHRNDYFISVTKGRVWLTSEFYNKELIAPCSFVAPAGVKHIGYHLEDTVWTDTHKVSSANIEEAEKEIFVGSYEEFDDMNNVINGEFAQVCTDIGISEKEVRRISEITIDLISQPENTIEIKESEIQGLGVFVKQNFSIGEQIATARIDGSRTPVGRYANHSDDPNAEGLIEGNTGILIAIKDLKHGDEVTVNYRESRLKAKILDIGES